MAGDNNGKNFYITTPIYYVNGAPHLGHVYTTVACDVIARYKRLSGYDVFFLTGTDEHGLKVHQAARDEGIDPQSFTDRVSQAFRDVLEPFQITNSDFIRTTEDRHKAACQDLWRRLVDAGAIYLDKYSGWYAVRDEAYYGEEELKDGPSADVKIAQSGAECRWVEEESYFFRLSEWQDKLLAYYNDNPGFIEPQARRNEVVSFVKSGLKDLSVSRTTFDWGVKVPDVDNHVMYVWIDALTNYLSALGYPDENAANYRKFWPADIHVVGKEIIRFHCVYWPAFLMAAGLPVPKKVYAHGWWTVEGEKMSKSLGNVIPPDHLIDTYGSDQSRFVLLRDVPFGNDGNFSHEQAVTRINADLANGLGNLAQRSLSMIAKNCDGKVPAFGAMTDEDKALLDMAYALPEKTGPMIDDLQIHKYLEAVWRVVGEANAYIDRQAPWKLKKESPDRMAHVLYVLAETIRCLAIMVQPVTPMAAARILEQLVIAGDTRQFAFVAADYALAPGTALPQPEGVFPRLMAEQAAA